MEARVLQRIVVKTRVIVFAIVVPPMLTDFGVDVRGVELIHSGRPPVMPRPVALLLSISILWPTLI